MISRETFSEYEIKKKKENVCSSLNQESTIYFFFKEFDNPSVTIEYLTFG